MDISTTNRTNATPAPRTLGTNRAVLVTVGMYVAVVVLAAGLRLLLIEGYHPVIRNHDEFFRFLNTMAVRHDMPEIAEQWGVFTFNPGYDYTGFPPVQMWVHAPVQRIVEANVPFPVPPDYIYGARFASLVASIITTALTAWMGWYMARPLGRLAAGISGFVAALVWATSPIIIHVNNLALIDPLLYPYIPLIVICSVWAIRSNRAAGVFLGLAFTIAAIYTKYILAYALMLPAIATAVLIWRRGRAATASGNWAGVLGRGVLVMLPWLAAMAAISAVSLWWLVFEHDMFAMQNRETNVLYTEGLRNALSPYRNWVNVSSIIRLTTGLANFVIVGVMGAWGYVYARRHKLPRLEWWLPVIILPFLMLAFMMISSVVVNRETSRMRYPIAPMIAMLGLYGLALAQFVVSWRHRQAQRGARPLAALIVAVVVLASFIPHTWENINTARAYQQQFIQQVVWEWTDATLPQPEGKIMIEGTPKDDWTKYVWDRTISGYTGTTPFEWAHVPGVPQGITPREYIEDKDIAYFFVSELDIQAGTDAFRAFVDELTLLKAFGLAPGARFPSYFYRMLPPQHTPNAAYADGITLAGYDLTADALQPGDALTLRPYWQAERQPTDNYSMFVHLRPADDPTRTIAQFDGPPAAPARLTPTWTDADELIVGQNITLTVPEGTAPGEYVLWVGLYNFQTGARLALTAGGDGYPLAITVE